MWSALCLITSCEPYPETLAMTNRVFNFPIDATIQAIGGRWKCAILCHLMEGPKRTGELLRLMQPLSSKVLTEQLKELQGDHLIEREAFPGKVPKVVYRVTELGRTLQPIIDAMCQWGALHAGNPLPAESAAQVSEV
ncbi:winged helix-turn-helix transcriptional regulator [Pseudomonas helleri]